MIACAGLPSSLSPISRAAAVSSPARIKSCLAIQRREPLLAGVSSPDSASAASTRSASRNGLSLFWEPAGRAIVFYCSNPYGLSRFAFDPVQPDDDLAQGVLERMVARFRQLGYVAADGREMIDGLDFCRSNRLFGRLVQQPIFLGGHVQLLSVMHAPNSNPHHTPCTASPPLRNDRRQDGRL